MKTEETGFKTVDESEFGKVEGIPTGITALDEITGVNGIPRRRITLLSGAPAVGKSSLTLALILQAQKLGFKPIFFDVEFSFDEAFAIALGVDLKKLWVIRTGYAEAGLDEMERAINEGGFDLGIIDSIGSLLPKEEKEKPSDGGRTIGAQARITASFVRRMVPILSERNAALVCITHEFTDIGTGRIRPSGGMKMEYHCSLHIRLKRAFGKTVSKLADGTRRVIPIEAELKKNKLAPTEGKIASLNFELGKGFVNEVTELKRGPKPKNI